MTCYSLGPLYIITDITTYSITADVVTVEEGGTVTFTITTSKVPDGTVLNYQLSAISGSVSDADFTTTGLFALNPITINNNTATFTATTIDEGVVEGTEIFRALLITDCQNTTVAQSGAISINEVPVAALQGTFGYGTTGNGFDYYTGQWKGTNFALAHDLFPSNTGNNPIYHPNLGTTINHKSSGAILDASGSGVTLSQRLTSTNYTSETFDISGRSVNWTDDFLFINYNVYRQSDYYRYWNADFASSVNSQAAGYDWDDSDGGSSHNSAIIGNRYTLLRGVGNNIEFYDALNDEYNDEDYAGHSIGNKAATHPSANIIVAGSSGKIYWQNVASATTPTPFVNLPTSTTNGLQRDVKRLAFTADGKFLIVVTQESSAPSNDPTDSSVLVYQASVSNGNLTLTLKGHPQQDIDTLFGTNRNYFNIRFPANLSVGDRVMAYGGRMYTISEAGVLTQDAGLTNYFMSNNSPAKQEIGNNYSIMAGRQFIINEDDTKVAVLGDTRVYSTGTFQGGVWIFNLL